MSVILDSIDITGLVAEDNFGVPIITETQIADNGSLIVYNKELLYTDITLVGGADWGWISLLKLNSIRELASVIGSTYILDYEGVMKTVRFRTEDIPVIEADRLFDTSITTDEDWYKNVVIKLMEV